MLLFLIGYHPPWQCRQDHHKLGFLQSCKVTWLLDGWWLFFVWRREKERNKTQEKFYKRYSDLAFANFQLVMANWVWAFLGHFRYNTIYFRENSILAYQVCIHLGCVCFGLTISENAFTPTCVFGRYRKLGQTELIFCINCKIRLEGCETISGFILPSNELHPRKIEERERNSKEIAPIVNRIPSVKMV